MRDHGSQVVGEVKELRIFRGHIGNTDSDVAVIDFAVTNQGIGSGFGDLRRNGKSHPRETARRRDQKGVDADDFAAHVDQRAARVTGINGSVGLNELARLAAIAIGIGPVESAYDSAGHGKVLVVRIAESQNGFARPQAAGIAPGNTGQIFALHFEDRDIGKWIGSDKLCVHLTPIAG